MVGMDDRVETRRMTKESGKSSSRKATREREKEGTGSNRGGIFQPYIYMCVYIYNIYIYYMCSWKEEKREIEG